MSLSKLSIYKRMATHYEADILLFNTGYWKYRSTEFTKYSNDFPAVSSEVAAFIRTELPTCKAVAIDTLSIENLNEAPENRPSCVLRS